MLARARTKLQAVVGAELVVDDGLVTGVVAFVAPVEG